MDALEATTNAALGLIVSWLAVYFVFPLWGMSPTATQSAQVTLFFFALSWVRSYSLRRVFRWLS